VPIDSLYIPGRTNSIGEQNDHADFLVLDQWIGAITGDMFFGSTVVASLVFSRLGAVKRHVTNLSTVVATDSVFHFDSVVWTLSGKVALLAAIEAYHAGVVCRWRFAHLKRRRAKQSNLTARAF
jgi:hypothetical protein